MQYIIREIFLSTLNIVMLGSPKALCEKLHKITYAYIYIIYAELPKKNLCLSLALLCNNFFHTVICGFPL
jgi:hypothetical protein